MKKVTISSLVGVGIEFEGSLNCKSDMRVDGLVRGTVRGDAGVALIVGPEGLLDGDIKLDGLIVSGRVTGVVRVRYLEMRDGGVVEGKIAYEKLEVFNGGRLLGKSVDFDHELKSDDNLDSK